MNMGANAHKEFLKWETMGVVTPLTKVEAGKYYQVLCCWSNQDGWTPLIPFLHSDPQLGLDADHYHYDTRFMSPRLLEKYRFDGGRTGMVVVAKPIDHDYVMPKRKRCYSPNVGGLPVNMAESYFQKPINAWFRSMEGRKCTGGKCPHYGTQMMDRGNGLLECPLHGLFGDAATGRIIPRILALERLKQITS